MRRPKRYPGRAILTGAALLLLLLLILSVILSRSTSPQRGAGEPTTSSSRCSGVTKNIDGTFSFSWLHVDSATGTIRDSNNCIVTLRGLVQEAAFGNAGTDMTKREIDLLTLSIHINYWRLNLNPAWWNTNVYVPNAVASDGTKGMRYQDWIQELIGWMKSDGLYVEIDKGPQFTEPPCGNDGKGTHNKFCPSQDSGSLEAVGTPKPGDSDPNDPNARQETSDGTYMAPAVLMWTDVARRFARDPAIFYDSWNEEHDLVKTNPQQWQANQNLLINTIRSENPRALTVVYYDQADVMARLHYYQPDVVIDFHVYPGEYKADTSAWPGSILPFVAYAHQDGHAVIFNEWGGRAGAMTEPYNANITTFAIANHIGLSYYEAPNLYDKHSMQLNTLGEAVAKEYAQAWNAGDVPPVAR